MASPDPPARGTITFDISHGNTVRRFSMFDTGLGRTVCQEVLGGKSYPLLRLNGDVATIVDIGANIGAAAVYFALCYPAARLFAFEPTPASFALLATNTADLPQVKAFDFGLFDGDRQATLFHGLQDPVQNSVTQGHEQTAASETVIFRETKAVFRELGLTTIDILKLDTEGCEVPILQSMSDWIPHTGVIYVEFHTEPDRLAIDRLLTPTHALCQGHITRPNRGELRYIARSRLPSPSAN